MAEDCAGMIPAEFKEAAAAFRKSSPWFPSPADIIAKHNELKRDKESRRVRSARYLPPPQLTVDQCAENIRRCRQIKSKLSHKWEMQR